MSTPKFKNRPNAHVKYYYNDGNGTTINQGFFVGRATAVVGVVLAITGDGNLNVLISKRSNKMRDEAGKFGVPCGYLDWNETRHEAMIREIYEETSLYLPDYVKQLLFNNYGQPFRVKDSPAEDMRENVSHLYVTVLDFRNTPEDFPEEVEKFTCSETALVKWMTYADFNVQRLNYEWAFNHDQTIMDAIHFFNVNYLPNK